VVVPKPPGSGLVEVLATDFLERQANPKRAVRTLAVRPVSLEDVFVYRVMALERQERARTKGSTV